MRRKRKMTEQRVTRHRRVYRVVTITKMIKQCEPIYVRFGEVVRDRRAEIGMTQQMLADEMDLSRGSIANIETGRQRLNLTDFVAFAKILRLAPHRLLEKIIL